MKIETQTLEDQQVKIVAEFENEVLENYKRRAARKIAKETKIPGFRPGKAPYDVVKRHYGEDLIQKEAIELLIDDLYPDVLKEADIKPSGPGSLEEIVSIEPPKFSFIVPLEPEVNLAEYHSIRKKYAPGKVTKKDVDQSIHNLQMNFATAEPVEDRPIQEGDLVYLTVKAKLLKPGEGEDPEFIKETPMQVIPGQESDEKEWPYPGFSNEVIGLSASEEKTVTYAYPKKSENESLRGKKAEFTLHIQSIKSLTLPELNDEFVQSLGEFENVDKLTEFIHTNLETQKQKEYDEEYYEGLIDDIVGQATVKYPPHLLEDEIEHILDHLNEDLAKQKMDLDTFLKARQLDKASFIENDIKPTAKKRLERSLVMDKISMEEKIEISKEELNDAVLQTINQIGTGIDLSQFKSNVARQNFTTAVTYETAGRLVNQRVMERLKAIATGELEKAEKEAAAEKEAVVEKEEAPAPKAKKTSTKAKKSEAAVTEKPAPKAVKKTKKAASDKANEAEGEK